jgi:hypothetical protein
VKQRTQAELQSGTSTMLRHVSLALCNISALMRIQKTERDARVSKRALGGPSPSPLTNHAEVSTNHHSETNLELATRLLHLHQATFKEQRHLPPFILSTHFNAKKHTSCGTTHSWHLLYLYHPSTSTTTKKKNYPQCSTMPPQTMPCFDDDCHHTPFCAYDFGRNDG